MPAPIPARDPNVYFVGAGLSVAVGLPNTAMLLDGVLDLARRSPRWHRQGIEDRLDRPFKYFYPDAIHAGYRPEVVDFFSALRTYLDVGAGLPGGFDDAPHLYRSLKSAIAHVLIEKLRQADKGLVVVLTKNLLAVDRPGEFRDYRNGHPFSSYSGRTA